ncbi:MAG: N-acetyltransferase family protein [Bacteroidia bacterium]
MLVFVREAGEKDAEVISKLSADTFVETYSWYNTPENMQEYTQKHFSLEQTKKDIATPGTTFFLAEANKEIIGYAKLRVFENLPELAGKRNIEIERIYVQKKHHDKKAGYAIIKKCIDFAKGKNYGVIWLGVWEKNERAIKFYEKVGFEKFGTHNFQLGDDSQNDYLLKLDLTD